ncbi:hypothetical protein SCUCBS95973_001528 [Sporothrix curviconia]|uniref:Uncharacterized protein n=1 Tax=Sporothrix curviconia TaxID=1260050 RepID=A0ABP0AZB0_9PEZI
MAPEKTRLSKPPATLNGAYDAVRRMAKSAGPAALSGAYTTRVRGNAIDLAIAEATITIAIAAATAARAVAGTEPTETISRWDLKSLADYADEALLSAEAAYVATSSIRSTNSWFSRLLAWMLTSVVGLVAWPVAWFLNVFQASLFVRSSPGTSISSVVNTIIDAALTATASVDSTVDAAMTTTTTTTIVDSKPGAKAEPCRTRVVKVVPYDPCDAKRLYMAARIAQSTAAVATAAARAVWFSHPVLSLRARRAAAQ